MHNFNYWLQDRDVKYFKEFYLLKGFFFNEQGEPEQLPKPQFSGDNRYRLIPKPGAKPLGSNEGFDPQDCVKVRLGLPDSDELIQKYENAWRAANAKNTAPNQAQNAVNVAASRLPGSRLPVSRLATKAQGNVKPIISDDLTQQIRKGYAELLKLNVDEALQGIHDTEINIAIGIYAIRQKEPTYKDLSGNVKDINYIKRHVFAAFGGVNPRGGIDPRQWNPELKKKYWNPTPEETRDLIDGKYDPTPTEPQKTSSDDLIVDKATAERRKQEYIRAYGHDLSKWQAAARIAAGIQPAKDQYDMTKGRLFATFCQERGADFTRWDKEFQQYAGIDDPKLQPPTGTKLPVAALTPAEDKELKTIKAELSKLTAQHKQLEDYQQNNSDTMSDEAEEKLLKDLSDIATKSEPLFKRKNELESKMKQNNTGGTNPDVASPVATQKPNASGSMSTKSPTGKNEKFVKAKKWYDQALENFKYYNGLIKKAYDEIDELEQWQADSEARGKTDLVEDAARKIEVLQKEIKQKTEKAEEYRKEMDTYKKKMQEAQMEEAQKEGNK
jgi:hypothetical protein